MIHKRQIATVLACFLLWCSCAKRYSEVVSEPELLPQTEAAALSRADVDLNRLADLYAEEVIRPEEQLYYEPTDGQTYRRVAYQNTQSYLYKDDKISSPLGWTDPELVRRLQKLGPEVQQLRRNLSQLQLDASLETDDARRRQIGQKIEAIEARLTEIGHEEYFDTAE